MSPATVLALAATDHDFSLGRFGGMHAVKKEGMPAWKSTTQGRIMEERLQLETDLAALLVQETNVFLNVAHLQRLARLGQWGEAIEYVLRFVPIVNVLGEEGRLLFRFLNLHKAIHSIATGTPDGAAMTVYELHPNPSLANGKLIGILSALRRSEQLRFVHETNVFFSIEHLQRLVFQGQWDDAIEYVLRFVPSVHVLGSEGVVFYNFLQMHKALQSIAVGNRKEL
ncbi:hypothetical protein ACQ4PT_068153 [Festuca glaucescens]